MTVRYPTSSGGSLAPSLQQYEATSIKERLDFYTPLTYSLSAKEVDGNKLYRTELVLNKATDVVRIATTLCYRKNYSELCFISSSIHKNPSFNATNADRTSILIVIREWYSRSVRTIRIASPVGIALESCPVQTTNHCHSIILVNRYAPAAIPPTRRPASLVKRPFWPKSR